jgi:hypothetical protein
MLFFIFMCLLGFFITMFVNYASGRIAYNQAYCIEKAKQHANPKTWDQLWDESGLTDEDARRFIEAWDKIQKEKN